VRGSKRVGRQRASQFGRPFAGGASFGPAAAGAPAGAAGAAADADGGRRRRRRRRLGHGVAASRRQRVARVSGHGQSDAGVARLDLQRQPLAGAVSRSRSLFFSFFFHFNDYRGLEYP